MRHMNWMAPRAYKVGDHVTWHGVRLVCTREHYAGEQARHPWDPGDGWTPEKAAALWTPNGKGEAGRLRAVAFASSAERLRAVLRAAA